MTEVAATAQVAEETGLDVDLLTEIRTDDSNLDSLLDVVIKNRERKERIERVLKDVVASVAIAEQELITAMTEQGLETFKSQGVTASRREMVYPRVNKEDREKQLMWLRKIGMDGLIQETVNSQTFGAFIRKEFEGDLPDFVRIHKEQKLYVRKAAGGGA